MTLGWCLARTKSLSEYMAAAALERSGYKVYFPRVSTPKPRIGYSDTPLFPGYLFVRQEEVGSAAPSIRNVAGVIGWVQFDGEVPAVPDDVIDDLDRKLETINKRGGQWTRYLPGQMVRVVSGEMESLAKVLEEPKSSRGRVRVLLSFMDGLVPARVPWHDLKSIDGGTAPVYGRRAPRRTRGKGRWVRGFGPRAIAGASSSRG